jgi:hypothetical protein
MVDVHRADRPVRDILAPDASMARRHAQGAILGRETIPEEISTDIYRIKVPLTIKMLNSVN